MNTIEKAGNRTIIKLAAKPTDPTAFDAYEIAQVAEDKDGECSPIDDAGTLMTDDGRKVFWSVYGHIPNAGVDCIADRDTYEQCLDLLRQMGVIDQGQIEAELLRELTDNDPVVDWETLADELTCAKDLLAEAERVANLLLGSPCPADVYKWLSVHGIQDAADTLRTRCNKAVHDIESLDL